MNPVKWQHVVHMEACVRGGSGLLGDTQRRAAESRLVGNPAITLIFLLSFFLLRGDRADPLLGVMGLGNLQCKRWDDDGAKKRCSAAVWLFCHLASEESPTFTLNRGVKKKKRWGRQADVRRYWVLTRRRQLVIQMMPCESVHILWTFQHLTTWKPKTFCALLGTKMVALYFLPFLLYKKEDNWIDSNTNTSICIQIKWVSI